MLTDFIELYNVDKNLNLNCEDSAKLRSLLTMGNDNIRSLLTMGKCKIAKDLSNKLYKEYYSFFVEVTEESKSSYTIDDNEIFECLTYLILDNLDKKEIFHKRRVAKAYKYRPSCQHVLLKVIKRTKGYIQVEAEQLASI